MRKKIAVIAFMTLCAAARPVAPEGETTATAGEVFVPTERVPPGAEIDFPVDI